MLPDFIPGLDLAEKFYRDAVAPALADRFAGLAHGACLLGEGSEVLGLDDPMSMDHDWGPRCQIILGTEDFAATGQEIVDHLAHHLPTEFMGFPTHFAPYNQSEPHRVRMTSVSAPPIAHKVEVLSLDHLATQILGRDAGPPSMADWLVIPQKCFLELTAGRVFHDDVGVNELRVAYAYYPRDEWLFLMAGLWWRLRRAERKVGRAGEQGDEIGARIILAGAVRDMMQLCFALERCYVPYDKWLGVMFRRLKSGAELAQPLDTLLKVDDWRERDLGIGQCLSFLVKVHNTLGLTEEISHKARRFGDRPFHISSADRVARALFRQIKSEHLKTLFRKGISGPIDVLSDNVELTRATEGRDALYRLFGG